MTAEVKFSYSLGEKLLVMGSLAFSGCHEVAFSLLLGFPFSCLLVNRGCGEDE